MFNFIKYFFLLIVVLLNICMANELNSEVIFLNDLKITSLMRAVAKNDVKAIKIFLDNNSNINERNVAGVGVLHIAVKNDALNALKYLIERKADINMIDEENWTPLMRACSNSNIEAVKILVDANAKIWTKNIFGEHALYLSVIHDCFECCKYLLEKDIENNNGKYGLILKNDEIDKLLKIAYKKQNEDLVNLLKEYRDGINKKGSLEKITKTEINYILDAKKMKEKELKGYLQQKYKEILE